MPHLPAYRQAGLPPWFSAIPWTEDPAFRIVSTNLTPYRVIYFGATYNFGKLKENVSKKKGVTNEDLVQ